LVLKAAYKDTLRHGIWIEYDALGIVTRKTKYIRGKIRWVYIYKNARLIETIDKKGKRRKMKDCGC
jgi:antitoxin component YwqK of YwqJK toxin-antitoxin module